MSRHGNFIVRAHDTRTISWWFMRRHSIDMAPPYQRHSRLWSRTDQCYLIDSILNGYDVPKLYMADFTWSSSPLNHAALPYAIIDGKQRLEAIFGFMEGDFVLSEDFVYRYEPSLQLGGLGYKDLKSNEKTEHIALEFENFPLPVMSVQAESEEPIKELFLRLNRSKPLTGAEMRNAMSGAAPTIIRTIADDPFFDMYVSFSKKRMAHHNAAAKILAFEYFGDPVDTKKQNLDQFVANSSNDRDRLELAGRHVMDTLSDMSEIFLPRDKLLSTAGMIPVFYWFVRNLPPDSQVFVREFLVRFSLWRRSSQSERISDIALFERYNRSTNDGISHRERAKILRKLFAEWIESEMDAN